MNKFIDMRNVQYERDIGDFYPFQRKKEDKNAPNKRQIVFS